MVGQAHLHPRRSPGRAARAAVLLLCGVHAAACEMLPDTHTASVSPDGRHRASVYRAFSIDPPNDRLYLAADGGPARMLLALAPDMDWCQTIVWGEHGELVGFLINDQHLALFDIATGEQRAMLALIDGDVPWQRIAARAVRVDEREGRVSFERFERKAALTRQNGGRLMEMPIVFPMPDHRIVRIVREERTLGRTDMPIPVSRLSLRIRWPAQWTMRGLVYVTLTAGDGRTATVQARPSADGVVQLPAFAAGPFSTVEVKAHGPHAILRDVPITADPVDVTLAM